MQQMPQFKEVVSESYINSLFKSMARNKEMFAYVNLKEKKILVKLLFSDRKATEIYIKSIDDLNNLLLDQNIEIAIIHNNSFFTFPTQIIDSNYEHAKIKKPNLIYMSYKRMLPRYIIEEDDSVIALINKKEFKISDINTKGISFISDDITDLKIGQTVNNVILKIEEKEIPVDCIIKYCSINKNEKYVYGACFIDTEWFAYRDIFQYIFNKTYPNLSSLSKFSSEEIYELFEKSGYFRLNAEAASINFKNMLFSHNKISQAEHVFINPVYMKDDKMLSSAALIRVYNRTFLGQHLISVPESRMIPKSKTDIYLGSLDYMLNHPYFSYYLTYFIDEFAWHMQMYKSFEDYINDKNKLRIDVWIPLKCIIPTEMESSNLYKTNNFTIEEMEQDYGDFIKYCENELDSIERECYGYNNENLKLNQIKEVYDILGLYLKRKLWRICDNDKILAYVVGEVYSNGLNLINLLDMCRIYLVDEKADKNKIIQTLLSSSNQFFRKFKKTEYSIIFKSLDIKESDLYKEGLNIPGVSYSGFQWGRLIANKQGALEYRQLLSGSLR